MSDEVPVEVRLAFVDISVFDDGSIRGGALVTDLETRPYEFRVTTPVKPTSMQRVLYGNTLPEYVYGELISFPLVQAIKEELSLVITKNENLLIMRPKVSFPVVFISRGPSGKGTKSGAKNVSTYSFKSHSSYSGESDWAETLLTDLTARHDPFEPFDRLKTAMDEVHVKKIGKN